MRNTLLSLIKLLQNEMSPDEFESRLDPIDIILTDIE